ncbi:MAG: hypothetical protein V4591_05780 [Bdellovibrionota bacterium]
MLVESRRIQKSIPGAPVGVSVGNDDLIEYFPNSHEHALSLLDSDVDKRKLGQRLIEQLEIHGRSLYGSEKENYNKCVIKNTNLVGEILSKITFLEIDIQKEVIRGQSNVQVEVKKDGSGYLVTIFDANKVRDAAATSIAKGSKKYVKQNLYRIDIGINSEAIVVEHLVSIATSSPIMKKIRAILAECGNTERTQEEIGALYREVSGLVDILKKDGFNPVPKISKDENKVPFARGLFVSENHGIDLLEAHSKFNFDQRHEIGELHIQQALQNIFELDYQFFDNKKENTVVHAYYTAGSEKLSFKVTHIDYQGVAMTPDCAIGQPFKEQVEQLVLLGKELKQKLKRLDDLNAKINNLNLQLDAMMLQLPLDKAQLLKKEKLQTDAENTLKKQRGACEILRQEYKKDFALYEDNVRKHKAAVADFIYNPKYKYYRFVESFLTYIEFVVSRNSDGSVCEIERKQVLLNLHKVVCEVISELQGQGQNLIKQKDIDNMNKAFEEIKKHFKISKLKSRPFSYRYKKSLELDSPENRY